jgi:hypothetical protein
MGEILNANSNTHSLFYRILENQIVRAPKDDSEQITIIEVMNPQTKEILKKEVVVCKGGIEGVLVGLKLTEFKIENTNQVLKKLIITLKDGANYLKLELKKDSRYYIDLINRLFTIINNHTYQTNPRHIMRLTPSYFEKNGKKNQYMNLYFGGESIMGFYSAKKPIPASENTEWKKVKFNGKDEWDKTNYLEFHEKILSEIISIVEKINPRQTADGGNGSGINPEEDDVF